jgi:hypothetical protein
MELSSLDEVVENGHAIVLVYSNSCRFCSVMIPLYEQAVALLQTKSGPEEQLLPFYSIREDKAHRELNEMGVTRVPRLLYFACEMKPEVPEEEPNVLPPDFHNPSQTKKTWVTTSSGTKRRWAQELDTVIGTGASVQTVLDTIEPFVKFRCSCPFQRSHSKKKNKNTAPVEPVRGTVAAHEALVVGDMLNDKVYTWIQETVLFLQDPVQYWRSKENRPAVSN